MNEKTTGITRAIKAVGTQEHLAFLLSERLELQHRPIRQSRIAEWVRSGYVPKARAQAVADVTGIPLDDLLRKPIQTKGRNAKGSN